MGGYIYFPPALKVLAVKWRLAGVSHEEICNRLGKNISARSIRRWVSLFRRTKSVLRNPNTYAQQGRPRFLAARDTAFIEALIDLQPSLFLAEIRKQLYNAHGKMPSILTIQTELRHRLNLTLKKAQVSSIRKNQLAKLRWMDKMMNTRADYLVFTGRQRQHFPPSMFGH